jgi:hypothetical protein
MSLTACLRKVGAALAAEDKAAVLARAGALRAEGLSATDAGRQAVDERLAEVAGQIRKVQPLVPEVARASRQEAEAKADELMAAYKSEYDGFFPLNRTREQIISTIMEKGTAAADSDIAGMRAMRKKQRDDVAKYEEMKAKVTETGSTHKDPGQPAEPATAAVVKESLAKAAENRNRKPSEMRAELLRMIDQAMEQAPDEDEANADIFVGLAKTRMRQLEISGHRKFGDRTVAVDARRGSDDNWKVVDSSYDGSGTGRKRNKAIGTLTGGGETARAQLVALLRRIDVDGSVSPPDTVTLKVPGDGTFKVLNTRQRLEEFRKKVEKSPGFKDTSAPDPVARTGKYGEPFGVERGSSGPKSAIEGMIDSGDPQAAADYAAARGLVLAEVLKGDKRRLPQVANLTPTAEALGEFEAEASLPDLIKAYKAAKAQERTLADAKNVDLNKLSQAVDATMAVRAPLIARLAELPALSAKNSMGLLRIVAGSAQKPGQWQLTRFDQNGEPWGDSQYSSQEAAIEDFLRDVDIETLEMGEAEPAAPAQPAPASEATPPAPAPGALPNPWDLSQDEFIARVSLTKEGSTAFPWAAKWGERILEAENEEYDHPDLGKTVVGGGRFFKTKREAEVVARGAHKRAVRRAVLNGYTVPSKALSAYPDLQPAKPAAQPITDLGEKIGGARKDLAESGGTGRARKTEDDRPAWARRFEVSQIVKTAGRLDSPRDEGRWVIHDTRSLNWMKQPRQVGQQTFATKEEAEAFVPIAAVGLKHRTVAASGGKYEIWRDINDRKRVKVVDQQFDTRDEAMRYMAQNAVAIIETNTTFGEADIPLPPNRSRTGPSRRTGNVVGEDFKEAFGLRGVEFGNWNNQDERQTLMNEAWDGLMDLADVLGVPPKALGLGGDLALAFGARGHGLHSARAHYERDRAVINLTKEKGAGTLAHEWLHAMDHYFGRQDGKASADWVVNKDGTRTLKVNGAEDDMVSSGFRGTRSNVRPELREAFNKVMQTIAKKAEGYVADTVQADKFVGRARDEVAEAVKRLRADLAEQKDPKYYKRFNKPASAELLAEFDAISARIIEGEPSVLATDWRNIIKPGDEKKLASVRISVANRWTNDSLERLGEIYKEVRGRGGFNAEKTGWMDRLRGLMTAYEQRLKMLADAQSGTEKQRLTPTEFAMNAKELDQGRNEDYWTTPHELAARAFQAYVEDKIAERGNVSRFLNYAPENAMLPTPWGFKRVYPAGQERQAINAAFDAFVKELKVKDEGGKTVLFSRRGSPAVNLPPAAIGGSLARVNNHPDYAEAKAGDSEASLRLARDLVTDGFTEEVRQLMGGQGGVLLPVIAQESAGRNKIPLAVAEVLAERMGVETDLEIAQATRTHRTDMDGLSRVLKSPEFYGTVTPGARYVLVDDTLTQGGTFASLANHIRAGGGEVLGVAALSGKRYSAALSLSDEYLTQLRERFGDVEGAFRAATGYGFDGLTESEGRYLVKHDAPEQVRDRILAAGREAGFREDAGTDGPGSGDRRLSSESPRERFRRLLGVPARGIPLAQARQMARAYEDAGLRGVNVAATPADLPADLRRRLEGAADDVRGAYFPDRDQTWVFSDRVNDPDEFAFVVLHEAFHRGLGKTFGRDAKRLMGQMYQTNRRLRERADKVAAELGINRDEAIEEALADMAGEGRAQKLRGWTKLSALIRTWLGKVLDAVGLRMTFSDAQIETFVSAMAREGLRNDARVTTGAGVDRLVAASKAARQEQTETPAFKRWFGDSKVVDAQGEPLVVYHGTGRDFPAFDPTKVGSTFNSDRSGFFFSSDPATASDYAEFSASGGRPAQNGVTGANVMPVYVSLKNPLTLQKYSASPGGSGLKKRHGDGADALTRIFDEDRDFILRLAKEGGHDGILFENDGHRLVVAFRPERIKSATGNNGSFDPANQDIRFSRRASTSLPAQAAAQGINIQSLRNAVMDRFRDAGAKVSWWDKTLGTQFDKAKRLPAFGKVFDKVQQYLEDTSTLANEAADQAPSILPKLDSVRDVWDAAKRGLSAKDREAIKAPIFEGTLLWTRDENGKLIRQEEAEAKADKLTSDEKSRVLLRSGKLAPGVLKMWLGLPIDQYEQNIKTSYAKHMLEPGAVFTPDELRSLYKLTDAQIKQYQEFRAAVNTSLDQVVATDALRMLGDVAELTEELHRAAVGDREGFRAALNRILDARIEAGGDEVDVNRLKQLRGDLEAKYAKVDALKARGYAPLMRFGTFKVVVPGKNGEDVDFFALYETKAEANAAARALNDLPEFRGRVEQGTLSEEAYKLFAQVPLESLEMFAEAIGAEQSEVFQEYLRMAKNNRSALKRLIQRKGIAGYNEDVSRVLASFVTSNARMAAGTVNLAQAKEAAQGIREGDVRDEAARLIDTVQNPTETAGPLRGLMFVHFIGGSIASAIVNVTQPVMMTTPYLSQWGGMAKASARLLAAGRQVSSGKIADPDSAEALRRAEKDGIVSPQEIHHLTAEAMQTFGRNPVMKSLAFIWGAPFSLAEQFNRRITFLAAYQTAKAEGMADPFEFAEKAVIETQGLYNKGNASNWARNPIGAVALTFKQYSIHYLEWLRRMWNTGAPGSPERTAGRKAVLFALAMLMLAGGVEGLPFAEDLNDLADTFMQAAGIDTSAKGWKRDFFANTLGLGDEGADVVMRGFSAVGGFPLDVSIRMGMGNLLPGTGIWLRSNTDVSRDVLELAGPAGSLLGQVKDAGQKALSGDAAGAATALLPVALQNAAKGVQMLTTGEARDTKDRKIMEADEMDAAMKIIGFQPAEIARESSKIGMERKRVQLTRNVEMKIADLWAQGLRERDADMVQEARQELLEWNQANPQSRIQITNAQVLKRLKDMQATRAERFQRAAPKELRQGLAIQ